MIYAIHILNEINKVYISLTSYQNIYIQSIEKTKYKFLQFILHIIKLNKKSVFNCIKWMTQWIKIPMLKFCKQGSSWKLNRCNFGRKRAEGLLQNYQNEKKILQN